MLHHAYTIFLEIIFIYGGEEEEKINNLGGET